STGHRAGHGALSVGAQPAVMKAIAQRREAATLEGLVGKVLCHDVRDSAAKIAVEKGARLTAATSKVLMETPWEEIHLLAVDPTDLHEEEAGKRLAAAVVGDGVEVKGYTGGQWTLVATRRGLLRVRRQARAVSAFRPTTIGVVGQERLDAKQRARFETALKQKIEWFGGRLLPITYAGGSPKVVADALTALRREGAEVLIVAGASALDPHLG